MKMTFAISLLVTLIAASCITNPRQPDRVYNSRSVLGEGRFGFVHRVVDSEGSERAMKSDKEPVRLTDGNTELDVLTKLNDYPNVGPRLSDSFNIETGNGMGRRYMVLDLVGPSVKSSIRAADQPFSEPEAIGIISQTFRMMDFLKEAGYYHNNIHYDNVAYRTPTDTENLILLDFGNAIPVTLEDTPIQAAITDAFSTSSVLDQYILPSYPDTEQEWGKDEHIRKFIEDRTWSPFAKVAIRNCRIFERFIAAATRPGARFSKFSIESSVDIIHSEIVNPVAPTGKGWFTWALYQTSKDRHIESFVAHRHHLLDEETRKLIFATRMLARLLIDDIDRRKNFTCVVKMFLEIVGAATLEGHVWFWGLMEGDRYRIDTLTRINSYQVTDLARRLLKDAWDVHNGQAQPDLTFLGSRLTH